MNPNIKIKILALASVFCFLLALYIFGYALDKYKTDPDDFTISRAVANGNSITAAVVVFAVIGAFLLIYLHHMRGFQSIILRDITIFIILGLFISIIFVTPYQKDGTVSNDTTINDAHMGLAAVAFILVLLYNLYTCFYLCFLQP